MDLKIKYNDKDSF